MNFVKRFFGHLKTVHKHRKMVRKLCFKCGLYWQGLTHDLSKYSPTEFWNGVKFYTGTKSPHVGERAAYGYSKAWLHHKGHNKHHAEYWQDIQCDGTTKPIPMPTKYLFEMICDRVAASMVYLKDKYTDDAALNYYLSHKHENDFNNGTRNRLEYWLKRISKAGVDKSLQEMKQQLKDEKEIKKYDET